MPGDQIPQSTSATVYLELFLTGTTTPATGKTLAVQILKNGGGYGNPSAGSTNATEDANGTYHVALSTTDTATLGDLIVYGTATGCDAVKRYFRVVKATNAGLTAIPDVANGATGAQVNGALLKWGDPLPTAPAANTIDEALFLADILGGRFGTAQAGAASTITLDSGASSTDGRYVGYMVYLYGGTGGGVRGVGQERTITAYNGTSKVATLAQAWGTTPDNTSKFMLIPQPWANVGIWNGTAVVAPNTAGVPVVDVSRINNVATTSVVAIGAYLGNATAAIVVNGSGQITVPDTQKVDVNTIKTNPVVNGGTITFPTGATLASTTNITAGTIATVTTLTNLPTAPTDWISAASVSAAAVTKIQSGLSTLTQTQVTGGAYSIQSASCVLGDARIANLDVAVSTRLASTSYTTPPTAVAIRTEIDNNSIGLAAIYARTDVATSTRLASSSYTAPPTVIAIRTEMDSNSTKLTAIKGQTDKITFTGDYVQVDIQSVYDSIWTVLAIRDYFNSIRITASNGLSTSSSEVQFDPDASYSYPINSLVGWTIRRANAGGISGATIEAAVITSYDGLVLTWAPAFSQTVYDDDAFILTPPSTIADGAIKDATFTMPAEAAGEPTGALGMLRRVFERGLNKIVRTLSAGVYTVKLRNAADSGDLEMRTQTTTGSTGATTDTQTKAS